MARWCLAALLAAVAVRGEEEERTDEVFLLQTRRALEAQLSSKKVCKGMVDLVFVIDESGSTCGPAMESQTAWTTQYKQLTCEQLLKQPPSVYPEPDGKVAYRGSRMYKYEAERAFLQDLIDQFTLGPEDMQVAIVGFSNNWNADSAWNGARVVSSWSTNAAGLHSALETTTGIGATYPHLGIELALGLLNSAGRSSATQYAVVMLDDKPSGGPWQDYANELKKKATVLSIGYSHGADPPTLEKIASEPKYAFSNFDLSATADILVEDDTFCDIVCEEATCEVFEDPHIFGFDDARRGPIALAEREASASRSRSFDGRPIDVNAYGLGDFWLIRSKEMLVQGRFAHSKSFKPDGAALGAVAIGGPFLQGLVLLVGPLESGRVLWHGQEVQLGSFSFSYPGGTFTLVHQEVNSKPPKHRVEANFSSGLRATIDRFARYLNVKLATRPVSGGIDGECGNFNRRHEDDSQAAVGARMGSLEVPEGQRLIPVTF